MRQTAVAGTYTCRECGDDYELSANQARARAGKYCSRRCSDNARAKRHAERASRLVKDCVQCGRQFTADDSTVTRPSTGKLCSRACWYAWQQEKLTAKVTLTCGVCGKEFDRVAAWVRKATSARFYCSRECQGVGRTRAGSTPFRGGGWKKRAESIRVRDGYACVRCGRTQAEEGAKLSVDHIVTWLMSKSEDDANHADNLASLCRSCHGVKTVRVEPRFAAGDWLSLYDFYGRERADAAIARALP